jgi:multiple RNA-binding domain-containing protein 1
VGTFKGAPKKKTKDEQDDSKEEAKKALDILDDDANDADAMPVATLFVKNLNFNTSQEQLKDAFSAMQGVQNVRIVTKPDKKGGKPLSMGFGFIEFRTKQNAMKAIKSMQGFKLDGHALELKFSNAAAKQSNSKADMVKALSNKTKATVVTKGTKLIVRNIPFEATKRDIQQLFRSFGQVKAVRVPTKLDGSHRGFGFVDFLTKQEAKSA